MAPISRTVPSSSGVEAVVDRGATPSSVGHAVSATRQAATTRSRRTSGADVPVRVGLVRGERVVELAEPDSPGVRTAGHETLLVVRLVDLDGVAPEVAAAHRDVA